MSAISMMELNAKSPFMWDWENLIMPNTKASDAPKTLQLVDPEIDGLEGFEVGSYYSCGGRSDGGTGSDLGYASSSKSSKSASVDSSTVREMKETRFTLEASDGFQQDFGRKRDLDNFGPTRTSQTVESSAASGESLTALELCNRTYFEDVSGASPVKNNAQNCSLSPDVSAKKSKSSVIVEIPRCQAEGCNVDLSVAKDYHRKHRVCETHARSPTVVINGHERRFCQQCSRFHGLSEFDQKKRSCRRRLSDHNARRRKPKPEVIQFNSMRLGSSLYDGRNQLNFAFNQGPVLHTKHGAWDSSRDPEVMAKAGHFRIVNGSTDGLHSAHHGIQNPVTKASPLSNHFIPSKGTASEVYQQGIADSAAPSNMLAAQDIRALSLLSTSSWSSCNPETSTLNRIMQANNPPLAQPLPSMHAVSLNGLSMPTQYWQTDEPASPGPGSHASSFQLFKTPNEPSFYLY